MLPGSVIQSGVVMWSESGSPLFVLYSYSVSITHDVWIVNLWYDDLPMFSSEIEGIGNLCPLLVENIWKVWSAWKPLTVDKKGLHLLIYLKKYYLWTWSEVAWDGQVLFRNSSPQADHQQQEIIPDASCESNFQIPVIASQFRGCESKAGNLGRLVAQCNFTLFPCTLETSSWRIPKLLRSQVTLLYSQNSLSPISLTLLWFIMPLGTVLMRRMVGFSYTFYWN